MPAKRETDQPACDSILARSYRDFYSDPSGLLNHRAAGIPPLDALNEMGARHFAMIADFPSSFTYNISQRVLI